MNEETERLILKALLALCISLKDHTKESQQAMPEIIEQLTARVNYLEGL